MSEKRSEALAWSLLAGSLALFAASLVFLALNGDAQASKTIGAPFAVVLVQSAFLLFPIVGTLIAARRGDNAIGWLLCGAGFAWQLIQAALGWATYSLETNPGSLPAASAAALLSDLAITPSIAVFPLLFLLFPNGRPHSRRWGILLSVIALAIFLRTLIVLVMPGPLAYAPTQENPLGLNGAAGVLEVMSGVFDASLGVSTLLAIGGLIVRFRSAASQERQQLKWLAYFGSLDLIALPIIVALGVNEVEVSGVLVSDVLFALLLVTIPIAIGIAVLRHGLYEIDLLINRTLVYGTLTAGLAGLYAASLQLFKFLFEGLTGETSEAAIVLTTLVLASVFTPAKNRLQKIVDGYFGHVPDPGHDLQAYMSQLRGLLLLDPVENARRYLDESVRSVNAQGGAVFLGENPANPVAKTEEWDGETSVRIPIIHDNKEAGFMLLGPRTNGAPYSEAETEPLLLAGGLLAQSIALHQRFVSSVEEPRQSTVVVND